MVVGGIRMEKRGLLSLCALSLAIPLVGVSSCPPPDTDGGEPVELITDRHFTRGFVALDPDTGEPLGAMNPGFSAGDPVWDLGQWGSLTSLDAVTPTILPSGAWRWEDAYGAVTIGPEGSTEADLSLRVNAYEEYGGVYRSPDSTRTWVHLLGEQRISPPGAQGPGCPPLSQLSSLDFSVDARLLFDERNIQPGYDPSQHAASYLIYFTVQNLNSASPGYGDYLWFGLTLYDDRDPMPGLYVANDGGTGKLIYNIGLAPLSSASLDDGQWHTLRADLLPYILDALEEAWSRGYLPDSRDLVDCRIGGMHLGWEVPGLSNVELQIRDLSLTYTSPAGAQVRWDFDTDCDTEGWTAVNMEDPNGGPVGGLWILTVPGSDPALLSPALQLDAASYGTISVTMANDGNPEAGSRMQVFWSLASDPGFREENSAWIDVSNGGGWQTYTIDLSAYPTWRGEIDQLRIDPVMYGDGHAVGIDAIVLAP